MIRSGLATLEKTLLSFQKKGKASNFMTDNKVLRKRSPEISLADLHQVLVGDGDARLCKEIPDEACREQPRNFAIHVASLSATKTSDGLADPKLVLAWLLAELGAPAALIGLLVPIRESLSLLPQLFTSALIRTLPLRKYVWVVGSITQGICVLGIAGVATALEGAAAGWAIIALLATFALARSACSVSYKDVLGKTISKNSRGTTTGTAGTIAAGVVLCFGVLVTFEVVPLSVTSISSVLAIAGFLWLLAGVLFSTVIEEPGATEGGESAWRRAYEQIYLLREDPQLVRFIAVRGLLTVTALAPPFLLALAGQSEERALASLGPFVIASALASIVSSYFWGRFADQSSRRVLMGSAVGAAALLGLAGAISLWMSAWSGQAAILAALLFALMICYQGVRLGRSTHLVDMADEDVRGAYTAISNTAIGLLLLVGGLFGILADIVGIAPILMIMAVLCAAAGLLAIGLDEVQAD